MRSAAIYFHNLNYEIYPSLIIQAITSVAHGTAVSYACPNQLVSDLYSLTEAHQTYLHCTISQFRDDWNEHILTFLPQDVQPARVFSPDVPIYRAWGREGLFGQHDKLPFYDTSMFTIRCKPSTCICTYLWYFYDYACYNFNSIIFTRYSHRVTSSADGGRFW